MSNNTDIPDLLKHLHTVFSTHGVHNVISKLRQLQAYGITEFETELIEAIIYKVISHYKTSREELFHNRCRAEARGMCFLLMKSNLGMNEQKIADFFGRHNKAVYRAFADYSKMSQGVKWQRDFLMHHTRIDLEVKELMNKLGKKKKTSKPTKQLID